MNYIDNGVTFRDILNAGLVTGGPKIAKGKYKKDGNNNITGNMPVINAIDIDWNNAVVPGIDNPITSTGQLLALIGQLKQVLGNINTISNQSVLDRLTLLESAVEELQNGTGGSIPDDLVEQLNNITSNITTLQNSNRDIQTRLTTLEQNGGGGNNQAIINQLTELTNKVNALDGIKHQIMEKTTYDALTSYDPNTLYFIIGEPDYIIIDGGGSGGGTTPTTRIDLDSISTQLTVNGQLHRESNIVLEPGGTYVVSGTLAGTLTIDASGYTSEQMKIIGNTEIILTDVIIVSDNTTYGILYKTPAENKGFKDLIITVNKNTANIVCCRYEQPKAENQWGAIHSMNNLTLRGTGYLSVRNDGGHGIRATEIDIAGPHLYATTIHDAIHAKKLFWNYGTLYTATANDVLGTSDDGRIIVFGGTFNTITLQENGTLFDSGLTGLYSDTVIMSGVSTMKNMVVLSPENYASAMQKAYPGLVYKYNDKASYTAGTNGEQVLLTNNIYKITSGANVFVSVVGVINKPIEIVTTGEKDATIYLNNVYIDVNENYPAIYFHPSDKKGKLKLFGVQDSINIIKNSYTESTFGTASTYESDAIKSENNINIEIKNGCHTYVSSKFADGIDGGTMKITDSKGSLVVTNCGQRGLKGNVIVIGPDVEVSSSHITSYHQDPDEVVNGESVYVTFDGNCIVKDNCTQVEVGAGQTDNKNIGFADIYARNGGHSKGEFAVKNSELNGVVIMGTIGAVVSIDMDNASNIYYNRVITPNAAQTKIVTASNENTVAYNIYKEPIA